MKNIMYIVVLVMLTSSAALASGSVQDGLCKVFLPGEGQPLFILEMQRNMVRDGAVFQFYDTGEVEKIAWYSHGDLDGTFRSFWTDGRLKSLADYKAGVRHGRLHSYDRSGNPQIKMHYVDGVLEGKGYYYDDGVLDKTVVYEQGSAMAVIDEAL